MAISLQDLLSRALIVYNEQAERMNSNVRIGSLLRDIVSFLDTKQDKESGKGLSTNDFSNQDKANLTTLVNLLNDNPDNVLNTISEVFRVLESYPEGVKVVDLLSKKANSEDWNSDAGLTYPATRVYGGNLWRVKPGKTTLATDVPEAGSEVWESLSKSLPDPLDIKRQIAFSGEPTSFMVTEKLPIIFKFDAFSDLMFGLSQTSDSEPGYAPGDNAVSALWDLTVFVNRIGNLYLAYKGQPVNSLIGTYSTESVFRFQKRSNVYSAYHNDALIGSVTLTGEVYLKVWLDPQAGGTTTLYNSNFQTISILSIFPETTKKIITDALRKVNAAGYTDLNICLPDANGSYPAFWIRDYAYSLLGNYNYQATEVLRVFNFIKSKMTTDGEKAYWVPDHINLDGTPVWRPGSYDENGGWGLGAALDGAGFLVDIAHHYIQLTNDIDFITDNIDFLSQCLASLLNDNYLVYQSIGRESCTYGFYDSVKPSGNLAFLTIQVFDAFKKLENLANIAGLVRTFPSEKIKEAFNSSSLIAKTISNKINNHGVNYTDTDDSAYIIAADEICRQFDVWASAYAVTTGILTSENELMVVNALVSNYDNYMKFGMAKHVPDGYYFSSSRMWERYNSEPTLGTYQNGGYWLTPVFWIYTSIKRKDIELASRLKSEIEGYALTYKFPEYVAHWGAAQNEEYVSSAVFSQKVVFCV